MYLNVWQPRLQHGAGAAAFFISCRGALVNHFYFYCVDADIGPFFIKFCTYFPYTGKVCINGHEWAKRQAARLSAR